MRKLLNFVIGRGRGFWLAAAASATVFVLLATGKLGLFVHPRYFWFTGAMAALCCLGLLGYRGTNDAHNHSKSSRLPSIIGWFAVVLTLFGLLVAPPSSLTPARSIGALPTAPIVSNNAKNNGADTSPKKTDGTGAPAQNSDFLDLATRIRAGAGASDLSGAQPNLQGFITSDPASPDTLLLTRYVITCCVVDAQTLTIPIYAPGWATRFSAGQWIETTGYFADNPDTASDSTVTFIPRDIKAIPTPAAPYLESGR